MRAPWKHVAFVEKCTPAAWSITERLTKLDIDGILVPSVQAAGFNLVLWRWNIEGAAKVAALDPLHDLPADRSSWKS